MTGGQVLRDFTGLLRPTSWNRREFLRRASAATISAALAGGAVDLLEACTTGSNAPLSTTPKRGGHLVEGYASDFISLNPLLGTEATNQGYCRLMFDPMIQFDENQNPVPLLAESPPKVGSDGKTYTFAIRKDVKWTDGKPLTVDDIVYTYQLIYDPQYKDVNYAGRATAAQYIESVTAPDDHTIVLRTKQIFAPTLLNYGTIPILPKHVLGNLSGKAFNTADFNSAPTVSSGMFKFVKWDKGQQAQFVRNESYYRGAPLLDSLVYRVVSKPAPVLQTGEVDFATFNPADLAQIKASGLTTANVNGALYYYMAFNLDPAKRGGQLFGQKEVRQALYYAMNRRAAGDAIFFKTETIVDSVITNGSWAYTSPPHNYSYDKTKAEQLLDSAGWRRNTQGLREKGSEQLKFEIVVDNFATERANLVQAIQQNWKDVGIETTIRVVDVSTWISTWTSTRNFEAMLILLVWGQSDPNQSNLLHSRSTAAGGFNCMGYMNPDLDKLLDDGVATLDRTKRKQVYAKVQEICAEDLPVLPILSTGILWGWNKRVQALKLTPFTEFANWYWWKDVWVSDGR